MDIMPRLILGSTLNFVRAASAMLFSLNLIGALYMQSNPCSDKTILWVKTSRLGFLYGAQFFAKGAFVALDVGSVLVLGPSKSPISFLTYAPFSRVWPVLYQTSLLPAINSTYFGF